MTAPCDVDSGIERVASGIEALLIAPILRPAFADCGGLGDYAIGETALALVRCGAGGFAAQLAAELGETR